MYWYLILVMAHLTLPSYTIYESSLFEVKATLGDAHFDGKNFDKKLVNSSMKSKWLRRLRTAERDKRTSSSIIETSIETDRFPRFSCKSSYVLESRELASKN